MSARTDAAWNELNANSYRKQDLDEQIMDMKADRWWVKKHFGESYRDWETDRKSTRLNSSHSRASRMPSSA